MVAAGGCLQSAVMSVFRFTIYDSSHAASVTGINATSGL